MKTAWTLLAAALLACLLVLALQRDESIEPAPDPPLATVTTIADADADSAARIDQGFLFGRVTTGDGDTYQGRLRWGAGEEAFWGDFFNGYKKENPWAVHVPPERLKELRPIEVFGVRIAQREREIELGRPFMTRFGDIVRIEPHGRDLQVTLKSGSVFHLDRLNADDLADGLRVWDRRRGVVDLDEWEIRSVELHPTPPLEALPRRLHGTVRTQQGDFTGFVQWNREECVGTDELDGESAEGERSLRFDTIRSIVRRSPDSSLVTLLDGREILLSGTPEAGKGHRGIYVDDQRYGRVLVSWEAFERVDFGAGGSGPAYDDFPPGSPLMGRVTTRDGRRLSGRLVWDLDESETTETLDAPYRGVNYNIPFGLIGSIVLPGVTDGGAPPVRLTLQGGEQLQLESSGDLDEGNTGMLIFVDGDESPALVPWGEVERIDFERPPAMFPPLEER